MRATRGIIPLADTTSQFAACNRGGSIVFMNFLHADGRKSLFTKFGPASVSPRLAEVSIAFDDILTA